jgi:protein-S-isoprenylcysteine O-methyltransferase Ste14
LEISESGSKNSFFAAFNFLNIGSPLDSMATRERNTEMESVEKQDAPRWARAIDKSKTYLSQDLFGGPRLIKMAWAINLHKGMSVFVVAVLMIWFRSYTTAAWVYLALHGTYGIIWLLKHAAFRDHRWETRVTLGGAAATFLMLATYWIAPYLLISNALGPDRPAPPSWLMALCIALFGLGLSIMTASDCQKHFTLKYQRGLITEGMFKYIRHPNYLGEMMLYASFALLIQHWIPWIILVFWWATIFLPNMLMIESSLSRYPEWESYKTRTGMLLPSLKIALQLV